MSGLVKWLLKKISKEQMLEIVKWIYDKLPVDDWINTACDFLAKQADKTETEIDDEFVERLRESLFLLLLGKTL